MNAREYRTELKKIILVMGKNLRGQIQEECVETREDISKHTFLVRNQQKALAFLDEQRHLYYQKIADAKTGSIMREMPVKLKGAQLLEVRVYEQRLDVIRSLRNEIMESTRKSLRQPDKKVYPVQKVIKAESYSTKESLIDLIEVAKDFVKTPSKIPHFRR